MGLDSLSVVAKCVPTRNLSNYSLGSCLNCFCDGSTFFLDMCILYIIYVWYEYNLLNLCCSKSIGVHILDRPIDYLFKGI